MDATTLVGATSQVSSDEELDEHLANVIPEPFNKLAKVMMNNLADEITFSALHPHLGVRGRLHGEGLALLAKTVVKYYK